MKGALVKELCVIKNNRLILLSVFYSVAIVLSVVFKSVLFLLPLFVIAFVAPLNYASYDDRYGWGGFAKALPYSARQRVAARYVVCGAEMLAPVLLEAVAEKITGRSYDVFIVHQAVLRFFMCSLILGVMLVICYRFNRWLRKLLGIFTAIIFTAGMGYDVFGCGDGVLALYALEPWFVFVSVVSACYLVAVSFIICVRSQTAKRYRRQTMRKGLSVTLGSLLAVACSCVCLLGAHGRLVAEPIVTNVDDIVDYDKRWLQLFYHNVRKTSNNQKLSQSEMYEVLRELADKEIGKQSLEEKQRILGQAGIRLWEATGLLAEEDEMIGSSKHGTLYCYLSTVSCDLSIDNSAKYIAVTDDSEMVFDFERYPAGLPAAELIDRLEEDGIPICDFSSNAIRDEYTGYIAFENYVTKQIRLLELKFDVWEGELESCTATWVHSDELVIEDYNVDTRQAEALKADMYAFAEAFSDKPYINEDMSACEEKVVAIGGKWDMDGVFTEYTFDTSKIEIKLNDSPAYPGKVMFFGAYAWADGAYANEFFRETEIASICAAFTKGMSDAEVVEILKTEYLCIHSITESADYTFDPPVSNKTYTVVFYTAGRDDLQTDKYDVCVNLVDGKVSSTEIRRNNEKYEFYGNEAVANELFEYLTEITNKNMPLPELITAFENMNNVEAEGVKPQDDTVLFEAMPWGDKFMFSLTRQIPIGVGDDYYQIHMDIFYTYDESKHKGYYFSKWSDVHYGNFFELVRNSDAYVMVADEQYIDVQISLDTTY